MASSWLFRRFRFLLRDGDVRGVLVMVEVSDVWRCLGVWHNCCCCCCWWCLRCRLGSSKLWSSEARRRAKDGVVFVVVGVLGVWSMVTRRRKRCLGVAAKPKRLAVILGLLAASISCFNRPPVGEDTDRKASLVVGGDCDRRCWDDLGVMGGATSSFSWFETDRLGMQGGTMEASRFDRAMTGWWSLLLQALRAAILENCWGLLGSKLSSAKVSSSAKLLQLKSFWLESVRTRGGAWPCWVCLAHFM